LLVEEVVGLDLADIEFNLVDLDQRHRIIRSGGFDLG
jgi:hypothetical protein